MRESTLIRNRINVIAVCALPLLLLGMGGCAVVGPNSIKSGRMSYVEAITATSDEQVLQMIVRDRYEQRMVPLTVSGVTANVSLATSAGVNIGFGPDRGYDGNLVPLSAGVAYEENPIISYVPVDTPKFLEQVLSPIPLDATLPMLRSSGNPEFISKMLLMRINSLKNPVSPAAGDSTGDFVDAVTILADLLSLDLADYVALSESEYGLLFHLDEISAEDREDELHRLLTMLELIDLLEQRSSPNDVLIVPIRFSSVTDGTSLALTTRSLHDLLHIAAAAVDVPSEHLESGRARPGHAQGPAYELIRIKRSKKRPQQAAVATRALDWWYYIDATDNDSKLYFRTLSALTSAQIASSGKDSGTPLLTVPVR